MEAIQREIREYVAESGKNPFHEWLVGLKDDRARYKIRERLDRIRLGNLGDFKSVGGGVFELRIPHGPGFRIYFGHHGSTLVILLCGGDKDTQAADIRKAQAYWANYRRQFYATH